MPRRRYSSSLNPRSDAWRKAHGKVLPFNVRRGHVRQIGRTFDAGLLRASAYGGAVAAFLWQCLAFRLAIHLDQHGVVYVGAKGFLDRVQIGFVAVCRKLNAIGEVFLPSSMKARHIRRHDRRPATK
ncbi:MAG: hypothetical protein EOR03_03500 [Mesorhizobium sp.]|nr:MAG: hypothetical protein EOR03_03500 [Mesorhizobium sp.]